ncbi:MAG: cation:proton antiporter, partial [Promicromonosporaceae bacterium]|nr:cation:proton antiporter [Promicromonosporaceae bacterium]
MLLVLFAAVIVIGVNALSRKVRVAAPLLLVVVGVIVSFLPFIPEVEVNPDLIMHVVLPALLYGTAVKLSTMDFRRDFGTISGLSVGLVIVTAGVVGLLIYFLIPDMTIPTAIALGAVLSPTDAVATQIIKKLGAPYRVVTVLESEGLVNDATAMVLLRSAVAASIVAVSAPQVIGSFLWAVAGAVAVGGIVGYLSLRVRNSINSPVITTAISFVVPYVAFWPAEHLEASGLVAVVVAGLVASHGSLNYLSPKDRFFEKTNWETIELMLEGAVFFIMGLEFRALVTDLHQTHDLLLQAILFAGLAWLMVVIIRGLFMIPLLAIIRRNFERRIKRRGAITAVVEQVDQLLDETAPSEPIAISELSSLRGLPILTQTASVADRLARPVVSSVVPDFTDDDGPVAQEVGLSTPDETVPVDRSHMKARRFRFHLNRHIADLAYEESRPLGTPEGVLLAWAGLKGALTLAAAQSLPLTFPHRSFVIVLAFFAAAGSLLIQGGSLPWVIRKLGLGGQNDSTSDARALRTLLEKTAAEFLASPDLRRPDGELYSPSVVQRVRHQTVHLYDVKKAGVDQQTISRQITAFRELWLRVITVQHAALQQAWVGGHYDTEALEEALSALDSEQIGLEL